ncbi:hypothetical protein X777_15221 [Ooceraea biroi]|uniref:Uncharacterized protein n=1 Tax=Ooceraea biroi TaxID=2015173 RepID=A0A026VVH0_OOCBI|nr:hypothetical protein X777_15221 [Ooceraea biroi]
MVTKPPTLINILLMTRALTPGKLLTKPHTIRPMVLPIPITETRNIAVEASMNSMEVLKYERTKAKLLIALPNIATRLKPYRLAKADTKGPEKVIIQFNNDDSFHVGEYGFFTFKYSITWKCANHIRYVLIIDPILINFTWEILIVIHIDCLTIHTSAQTYRLIIITDNL